MTSEQEGIGMDREKRDRALHGARVENSLERIRMREELPGLRVERDRLEAVARHAVEPGERAQAIREAERARARVELIEQRIAESWEQSAAIEAQQHRLFDQDHDDHDDQHDNRTGDEVRGGPRDGGLDDAAGEDDRHDDGDGS